MMGTKVNDKKHLQIVKNIEIKKSKVQLVSKIILQEFMEALKNMFLTKKV